MASPSALEFTDRIAGSASEPQTVTLTNDGESALIVQNVAVEGPGFVIAVDDCSGKRLAEKNDPSPPAGTVPSCTVRLAFAAPDLGAVTGRLIFNAVPGQAIVELTGLGTGPRAVVDQAAGLAFSTTAGTASSPQRVMLQNVGNESLAGISVAVVGSDFALVEDECTGRTLTTSGSAAACVVDVAFVPPAAGTYSATLRLLSNDPVHPTLDIVLTGTGTGTGTGRSAVGSPPEPATPATPATPAPNTPGDGDGDGVLDDADTCVRTAGDLKNGCPSELKAEVRGRWRVNHLFSQLLSLTVRAPTGSRISIRCSGRPGACSFSTRIIARTTRHTTSLTRYFKGKRILPAHTTITVRVTRPQQIGIYERVQTRTQLRLPKVTEGCVGARIGNVRPCP